ncbi:hypothetical protein Droror1_Dr00024424 [Drosera rotundifolia]
MESRSQGNKEDLAVTNKEKNRQRKRKEIVIWELAGDYKETRCWIQRVARTQEPENKSTHRSRGAKPIHHSSTTQTPPASQTPLNHRRIHHHDAARISPAIRSGSHRRERIRSRRHFSRAVVFFPKDQPGGRHLHRASQPPPGGEALAPHRPRPHRRIKPEPLCPTAPRRIIVAQLNQKIGATPRVKWRGGGIARSKGVRWWNQVKEKSRRSLKINQRKEAAAPNPSTIHQPPKHHLRPKHHSTIVGFITTTLPRSRQPSEAAPTARREFSRAAISHRAVVFFPKDQPGGRHLHCASQPPPGGEALAPHRPETPSPHQTRAAVPHRTSPHHRRPAEPEDRSHTKSEVERRRNREVEGSEVVESGKGEVAKVEQVVCEEKSCAEFGLKF